MIVGRSEPRNTRITSTAIARPIPPSTLRSWMDCSMKGAWSKIIANSAPLPRSRSSSGSFSLTPCATLTVFAPAVLVIETVSDGFPLTREMEVVSTGCSLTLAMSPSGTGPSVPWTSSAFTSSTPEKVVPTWTSKLSPSVRIVPAGSAVAFAANICPIRV